MIDMEAALFTGLARALRTAFPGVTVAGEYVNAPSKLPFVSIEEADNFVDARQRDSSDRERYAALLYEVNVYSNKAGGKKGECRKILGYIDAMMYELNFTRISMNPVPNLEDGTIYRLNARYEAMADGEKTYRR